MVTDRFDGTLARSHGMITEFGKLADPIADKALLGAALIGLSLLHDLAWWVTIVILVREIGITVLRFAVLRRGVIPASHGGKLKTLVQAIAIGLFILPLTDGLHTTAQVVMGVAIVLTVVTGIEYVVQAIKGTRQRAAGE
jgi:CDP-diacylglycerol--glycerol-3-phosphate 3-phosphatidyltransferase